MAAVVSLGLQPSAGDIDSADAPHAVSVPARLYWPQLDGLRFIAASLVFLAHAPVMPLGVLILLNRFGWSGVDLFLALSAFLLTRLLRAEFEATGSIDVRRFYLRRMLRIWPLHLTFVTAMLCLHCFLHAAQIRDAIGFWLSHLLFVNNLVVSNLGFERRLIFCSHLWTISLEEQFYVIIPIVALVVLSRRISLAGLRAGFVCVVLGLIGARSACAILEVPHPFIWVLPIRGDAIVLGMALGMGVGADWVKGRTAVPCFLAGLAMLVGTAFMPSFEHPGWSQVLGYTFLDLGCVLMVAGATGEHLVSRLLSNPVFRYLGKISFGIYVYHLITIAACTRLAAHYAGSNPWLIGGTSFAVTILVAALSYSLFERRFLVYKERLTLVKSRPV